MTHHWLVLSSHSLSARLVSHLCITELAHFLNGNRDDLSFSTALLWEIFSVGWTHGLNPARRNLNNTITPHRHHFTTITNHSDIASTDGELQTLLFSHTFTVPIQDLGYYSNSLPVKRQNSYTAGAKIRRPKMVLGNLESRHINRTQMTKATKFYRHIASPENQLKWYNRLFLSTQQIF